MKTMIYTLAFIDGKVCYECLPDTKGAFLFHGGWFMPFCDEDDSFRTTRKEPPHETVRTRHARNHTGCA